MRTNFWFFMFGVCFVCGFTDKLGCEAWTEKFGDAKRSARRPWRCACRLGVPQTRCGERQNAGAVILGNDASAPWFGVARSSAAKLLRASSLANEFTCSLSSSAGTNEQRLVVRKNFIERDSA